MPQRNSGEKEQPPTAVLRRSPRFLQTKLTDSEDPKTPFPKQQRRARVLSSATPLTSTGRKIVSSRKIINKPKIEEVSKPFKESNYARKCSNNPQNGSRRSTRLNHLAGECEEKKTSRSCNGGNRELERPVTRSYCCGDTDEIAKKIGYSSSTGNTGRRKTEEGVDTSMWFNGESLKNQVKDSKKCRNHDCDLADEGVSNNMNNGVLSIIEHHVLDDELPEKRIDKLRKRTDGRVDEVPKQVGVKRKRNHAEDNVGISQGWTKDQELALERAYLTAKPTPHFWKKVSRLVPGKSAQDCFDKIHCSHLTPPQPRPRSRALGLISQNTSLSASTLLDSSVCKVKRPRCSRQKSHVIQRTIRHMLQKQHKAEKDSEADLFSVLEPMLSPLSPSAQSLTPHLILTTPDRIRVKGEVLKKCQERSSTAHKKSLSSFSSSYETTLVSPPVLKQVKNKALHEKYIDQLNCREANRKAASLKAEKLHQSKGIKQENSVQRKDTIKAAKNALVFDARDAIIQFQHQQAKELSSTSDDDSGADNDEVEGEDFF